MSSSVAKVNFTETSLSKDIIGEVLERLVGYFLYSRGL